MKTLYDPKLREAAEEFKALCRKYDCSGTVLFVSPTHAEFVNELSPSWSVVKIEGPETIRFRSKRADFASKEEQHAATGASAHMLTSLVEWSRQVHVGMSSVLMQLQKHIPMLWKTWDQPDSYPGDGL